MKIEIRDDAVLIDGYVNAVERNSKVLHDEQGAFIEQIKAGVFERALERAKKTAYNIKVLLNHDYNRELTNTGESTTDIVEDNIGLRCKCEIRDAEVVEKAKAGKLSGWSFGFICLNQTRSKEKEICHREVRELELKEVSILDDTKTPAYNGTSIETRADGYIEVRAFEDNVEVVDNTTKEKKPNETETKTDLNYQYKNRYMVTKATL